MDNGEIVLEGTSGEVFAKAEVLRRIELRLPRIGHLMEILMKEDGFEFDGIATTISGISGARGMLKSWK